MKISRKQKNDLRKLLAIYAHRSWSHWMKYLFEQTIETGDNCEEIQGPTAERWKRLMHTSFNDLTKNEKESDYKEADRIIAILERHLGI